MLLKAVDKEAKEKVLFEAIAGDPTGDFTIWLQEQVAPQSYTVESAEEQPKEPAIDVKEIVSKAVEEEDIATVSKHLQTLDASIRLEMVIKATVQSPQGEFTRQLGGLVSAMA